MARVYGWPVGLTRDDLICVPGMLAFGFAPATDPITELGQLFCDVGFHPDLGPALNEIAALPRLEPQEVEAIYLCPLERLALDPDVVVVYGNPAQIMRLVQAASFALGERVSGDFGGKVECSPYLIGPYRTGEVRVTIPGAGDRIFSMTQDDEMVISFPAQSLEGLLFGLKEAATQGGRPVSHYLLPEFHPRISAGLSRTGQEVGDHMKRVLGSRGSGFSQVGRALPANSAD